MEHINDEEYNEKVLNSKGIVLLDFFATWCGPCRMLSPVLEDVESENDVVVYKMDVDENQKTPREFGVMSIPTVCVFKDGKFINKFTGFRQKEEIEEIIKNTEE